jgi:hypothetical protein
MSRLKTCASVHADASEGLLRFLWGRTTRVSETLSAGGQGRGADISMNFPALNWAPRGRISMTHALSPVWVTVGLHRFPWGTRKRERRGKDILTCALKGAQPRFRFVSSVRIELDGNAAIDAVAKGNPQEAIVEARDVALLGSQRQFGVGSVSIRQYQPDEIILGVQPKEEGFLVIANAWNPHLKARLDDKSATFIHNHAQFGLPVPQNAPARPTPV